MALHPFNDRVGVAGIPFPPESAPRHPPKYVALDAPDVKHRSPLCPDLATPFQTLGAEEAVYVIGAAVCDRCRMYDLTTEDSGWTDPRYRRDAPDEVVADTDTDADTGDGTTATDSDSTTPTAARSKQASLPDHVG